MASMADPWARVACAVVLLGLAGGRASASTDPPSGYYAAAFAAPTAVALRTALHEAIRGHRVLPYTATGETDTWDALVDLDADPADSGRVSLVYSGGSIARWDWGNDPGQWNREHLWPRSYGLNDTIAFADVFNLRPCEAVVNETRSNLPYDLTTTPRLVPLGAPDSSYDLDSWEPRDADKGFIARALFYMVVRYEGGDGVPNLTLGETTALSTSRFARQSTLLAWNRAFPPDSYERTRNHKIHSTYQFNRNPFIDRPEFADQVLVGMDGYEAWQRHRFAPAEVANGAVSGEAADPDGDGVPNLLEYALGRDPRERGGPPLVVAFEVVSGQPRLVLTHRRHREAARLGWTYEVAQEAGTGWVAATPLNTITATVDWQTEQVTVRLLAPGATRLVRLRVTR